MKIIRIKADELEITLSNLTDRLTDSNVSASRGADSANDLLSGTIREMTERPKRRASIADSLVRDEEAGLVVVDRAGQHPTVSLYSLVRWAIRKNIRVEQAPIAGLEDFPTAVQLCYKRIYEERLQTDTEGIQAARAATPTVAKVGRPSKLTPEQRAEIVQRVAGGEKHEPLGLEFGVKRQRIGAICKEAREAQAQGNLC